MDWNKMEGLTSGETLRGRWLAVALPLICIGLLLVSLSGCGGGSGAAITIEISPNIAQSVDQGQSLNFTATLANDTNSQGVTWTITGTGCAGAGCGTLTNVTTSSVTFVAPPAISATTVATLKASSVANTSVTASVTITIVLAPVFTTNSLANGFNGIQYNQTIVVTGGVTPLTFTATCPAAPCLPAGLTLNSSGTIVGVPSGSGTSNFTVKVTDFGSPPLTVSEPLSITISPPPALSILTTTLPGGILNLPYNAPVVTNGGVPPLKWTIVSGSLPPGLTISSISGQISGTPTSSAGSPFNFTVQVQDSALPTNQKAQMPLSINIVTPQPLQITTAFLPSGTTGDAYTASLQASGGVTPYTFSVVTGLLPSGLILDPNANTISGSPIVAGTSNFQVKVTDSDIPPRTASEPLSIIVAAGTNNLPLLNGSYAFLFNGFDSVGTVGIAGAITANGAGTISGGVEDVNRNSNNGVSGITIGATLTGTYTIGSDGRGTMELTATNSRGQVLTTDYLLVFDSDGNARFFEEDTTGTQGEGIIKKQLNSGLGVTNFTGNYAFEFFGQDFSGKAAALAGVVFADASSTLTPGMADFNDAGTLSPQLPLTGHFTFSGAFNRGSAGFTYQIPTQSQISPLYIFYMVSPSELFFVSIDTPTSANPLPRLAGEMIAQSTAAAFDPSALNGTSVASGSGINTNASVFAGLLTANGSGAAFLMYDENSGGTITPPTTLPGTYTVLPNGRVTFTNLGTRLGVAYLTGRNQGFVLGADPAATVGFLDAQSIGPPFGIGSVQGEFTLGAIRPFDNQVLNVIGQVAADGAGNLAGVVDEVNPSGAGTPDQPFTATFTVATTGRGILTPTNTVPTGIPTSLVIYVVSPSKFRAISITAGDSHPQQFFFDH
ncbi:MAG: Ig domain-containing protein [Candidatus Acidiferrales bacterium]